MVQDQLEREEAIKGENVSLPRLPDVQPLASVENQKLLDQLSQSIKVIGDQLNQEQKLNQ